MLSRALRRRRVYCPLSMRGLFHSSTPQAAVDIPPLLRCEVWARLLRVPPPTPTLALRHTLAAVDGSAASAPKRTPEPHSGQRLRYGATIDGGSLRSAVVRALTTTATPSATLATAAKAAARAARAAATTVSDGKLSAAQLAQRWVQQWVLPLADASAPQVAAERCADAFLRRLSVPRSDDPEDAAPEVPQTAVGRAKRVGQTMGPTMGRRLQAMAALLAFHDAELAVHLTEPPPSGLGLRLRDFATSWLVSLFSCALARATARDAATAAAADGTDGTDGTDGGEGTDAADIGHSGAAAGLEGEAGGQAGSEVGGMLCGLLEMWEFLLVRAAIGRTEAAAAPLVLGVSVLIALRGPLLACTDAAEALAWNER